MKKIICFACFLVLLSSTVLCSCKKSKVNEPHDEFYAKTSAANTDTVIEIKAENKTYTGEGDLRVRTTVGFGCLPDAPGYGEDAGDTFKVEYLIIEAPWVADKRPAWEMVSEYEVSFHDEMFASTEKVDGEFYPNFKEEITLTFPEGVEKGYLEIRLYEVVPERGDHQTAELRVYFEYIDGVLTFEP